MKRDIPAPGFSKVSGKQGPRGGESYWVQCGCGWVDMLGPWPAKGPKWTWDNPSGPGAWEVAAVRKAA